MRVIVKSKSDKLNLKVYLKCKCLRNKVDPNIGKILIMKVYWKLAKCWSWKYIEKANMFDIVKVIVKVKSDKLKWKVYWQCKCFKKINLIQIY